MIVTENGTHAGHSTWAKIRKIWVAGLCHALYCGSVSDIHRKPSHACCAANNNGIAANGCCDRSGTVLIDTIPTVVRTALAVKLALAEKHMV
jgi:hypothetical protein